MNLIVQIINGLQIGSIYALVALGYTMVYGIVKLINFAHGDIIMVGAYIAYIALTMLGLPFWLAIIIAVVFCAVLGVLIERIAYKPLRSSPRISALITAIGTSLFLENLFQLLFKADPRSFPRIITSNNISLGDISIGLPTLVTIITTLVLMTVLQLFINKTKIGRAMRAVSEDSGAAQLMGININTTISITFAIGSALAAVGAMLYCLVYPQISPLMGSMLGLKAFVAAVFGGIGIIPGAIIGGLIIGLLEALTKAYISSQLADAVVFGVLIIVLLVKPAGILGRNTKEKV